MEVPPASGDEGGTTISIIPIPEITTDPCHTISRAGSVGVVEEGGDTTPSDSASCGERPEMARANSSPALINDKDSYGYSPDSKSRYLFGRMASRANGYISTIPIPKILRSPTFQTAGYILGMKLNEAELPLESYSSFSSLFSRRLKAESRYAEIVHDDVLLSPVDGLLLNYFRLGDKLKSERVTQVKGASYHVGSFLGENLPKCKPGISYYAAVLYLSPADYHHFHAPCSISFTHRRHFQGDMYPVAPLLAKNMDDLFSSNERVVLAGTWSQGLMYYCPVAAYNVGDIRIVFDPSLRTNRPKLEKSPTETACSSPIEGGEMRSGSSSIDLGKETIRVNEFGSKVSEKYYYSADPADFEIKAKTPIKGIGRDDLGSHKNLPVDLDLDESPTTQLLSSPTSVASCSTADTTTKPFIFDHGIVHAETLARIGEFKLGSTVVLIFEAPEDFQFVHEWNTKVQIGQLLGHCGEEAATHCRDALKNYNKRCSPQRSPLLPITTSLMAETGPTPLSPTIRQNDHTMYTKVDVSSEDVSEI